MSRPLVSVVVPTYDRAGHVETAILSLLEQDYPALEVLAVDDGSRDETPAVLARIAEQVEPERFRWLRHENVGQAASVNRGFGEARGELLGYLSSDDYLLPGAISRLVGAAEQHPEAEVFYPGYQIVDEVDRVTDTVHPLQHTLVDSVRWAVCIPGVGALVRRSFYERVGGWDPSFHFSPDYEWWLRAGETRFVRVPQPGGAWRIHGGSITAGRVEIADVRERLRERFAMLDAVYTREDLPAEVQAVEREAYSTMLIEMGLLLDPPGIGSIGHRFAVEDRLGELFSRRAAGILQQGRLWSDRRARYAEHRATAAEYVNGQLQQTADALLQTLEERRRQTTLLAAELVHLREQLTPADPSQTRPLWLRVARQLMPPPLRARAGAALHRARGMARS